MADEQSGNQPQAPEVNEFLGTTPDLGLDTEEASPEPEAVEGESGEGAETADAEPSEANEGEQGNEPDQFLAGLSPEEHAYYAKRYPTLYKAAQDPNQPADLRQAFIDRVNQDHEFAKLRDSQGEPTADDEDSEPQTEQPVAPQTPEQFEQALTKYVEHITDPQVAEKFTSNFEKAWEIQDPKARAMAVTQTMSLAALNLMRTALPDLLFQPGPDGKSMFVHQVESYMNSNFEGLKDIHTTQSREAAWNQLRESAPEFQKLPSYNSQQWKEAMAKVADVIPGFENYRYTDPKTGQPVSTYRNFVEKSKIAARVMSKLAAGVNPAVVAQAVATGKKQALQTAQKRAQGKALGIGQSTQQFENKSSGDPVMDDLDRAIMAANSDMNPFTPRR